MKVLLWEMGLFCNIVLWDGENTYWSEEMIPSGGYKYLVLNIDNVATQVGRFTLIGDL